MRLKRAPLLLSTIAFSAIGATCHATEQVVTMYSISPTGVGIKIGSIAILDSSAGLLFKLNLEDIPDGEHGFHVHENGDCGPGLNNNNLEAGIAAGRHYDPLATKSHKGPHEAGHKGDLPKLKSVDNRIMIEVIAPKLKFEDVEGRSLMIHESGDNYADQPEGGGGKSRIACAVVPKR